MSFRILVHAAPICLACFVPVVMTGCGDSDNPDAAAVQESGGSATGGSASTKSGKASPAAKTVEQAVALIQQQQFQSAVEVLNEAIEQDGEYAEAYFQRAGIYADAGRDAEAIADYNKALALAPKETRFLNMKGLFLLTRQQYDEASATFTEATKIDPSFAKAYNNRGLVELARRDFAAAARDFQKGIEIDPKYVDAYNNFGFACYQNGDDAKALKAFNQALELSPDYFNAYNNRAMLYMRAEKFAEAAEDFTKAIELNDSNIQLHLSRMTAWRELGRDDLARADEDRVRWLQGLAQIDANIRKSPDSARGYIQRASHLAEGGHSQIALTSFEKALELSPGDADALTKRASFWLNEGEPQKAIDDCNAALQSLKASGEFNYKPISVRGDAWLALGKLDEAIADYTAAQRLDENVALAYYKRALLKHSNGDKVGANADLAKARQLNPDIGK